jgi:hypothetical protein
MLDTWIERNPELSDGPRELPKWFEANVDNLTEQAPDLAKWIRDNLHKAQLK